jgi:hypothetical protein
LPKAGLTLNEADFAKLLAYVWPSLQKMKRREEKYAAARAKLFTTDVGRAYLRELSIDELPGLTTPETTAIMLALCEALGMKIHFVAPAFGFQKNMPYPDNAQLRTLIEKQWACANSLARASVSTPAPANRPRTTKSWARSRAAARDQDQRTLHLRDGPRALRFEKRRRPGAVARLVQIHPRTRGARRLQRRCHRAEDGAHVHHRCAREVGQGRRCVCESDRDARPRSKRCPPSPEHMFWFEYNFLHVLAAGGRPEKAALGDHTPAGYQQRARFYTISDEGRLNFAKNVASYIVFLAENTGLAPAATCAARQRCSRATRRSTSMLNDISK